MHIQNNDIKPATSQNFIWYPITNKLYSLKADNILCWTNPVGVYCPLAMHDHWCMAGLVNPYRTGEKLNGSETRSDGSSRKHVWSLHKEQSSAVQVDHPPNHGMQFHLEVCHSHPLQETAGVSVQVSLFC
jgi:hypothetical protein